MVPRAGLLAAERTNAALAWAMVAVLLLAAVDRVRSGEVSWAGLAAATVALALAPPVVSRRPTRMVAWEVLGLAAVPPVARSLGLEVAPLAYLAVAALALVVAVELDAFTPVEMTASFAVAFVVVVTMAAAGLWTVAQFAADVYLGTSLLGDETAVMWDLVGATAVGLGAGVVFERYVRRHRPGHADAGVPPGPVR